MSKRKLDFEKTQKIAKCRSRGTEQAVDVELTEGNLKDYKQGREDSSKAVAELIDKIRAAGRITAENPKRQIEYLNYLYRNLSPELKRAQEYGLFIKRKVNELRAHSERNNSTPEAHLFHRKLK